MLFVTPGLDCGRTLRSVLGPPPSPRITVLGDSVTRGWYEQLVVAMGPCNSTQEFTHDNPRRSLLRYMGMSQVADSTWVRPVAGIEGPTVSKAPVEPFRTMLGCNQASCATWYAQTSQCHHAALEYLPFEFARDVEFPVLAGPDKASTTQGAAGLYPARAPRDVCWVNSGLHDFQLAQRSAGQGTDGVAHGVGNLSDTQYVANVAD